MPVHKGQHAVEIDSRQARYRAEIVFTVDGEWRGCPDRMSGRS